MPDTTPRWEHSTTEACDIAWWSVGEGPTLLCLHGFPDTAETWRPIAEDLAASGHRVLVPAMPGYAPSGPMKSGDHHVIAIADALLDWLSTLGIDTFSVLGHDWGAVTAYALANLAPERVQRMACAAVPHPRRMLRPTSAQIRRSWYIGFFQLPWLAERRLADPQNRFLRRLWHDWSPGWAFSDEDFAPVAACFSDAGVRKAALAYYRALPRSAWKRRFRQAIAPVAVPTLQIAGMDDGCIGLDMFHNQEGLFTAEHSVKIIANAGHFMHRESPTFFVHAVRDFIAATAPAEART